MTVLVGVGDDCTGVFGEVKVGAAPPPLNVRTDVVDACNEAGSVFFPDAELVWLGPPPVPVFPGVVENPEYVALNVDARAR